MQQITNWLKLLYIRSSLLKQTISRDKQKCERLIPKLKKIFL